MSSNTEWSTLRREAHRLDGHIAAKLTQYSKAASRLTRSTYTNSRKLFRGGSKDHVSVKDDDGSRVVEDLRAETEDCLQQLQDVIDVMGKNTDSSDSVAYTVDRYRSILRDLRAEYVKTSKGVDAQMERVGLLGLSGDRNSSVRSRNDHLLAESNSIQTSMRLTDDLIGQATDTKSMLSSQRNRFQTITSTISGLQDRFPSVDVLIRRIQRSRNRDMIVLSLTCAICIAFMMIYWWNK
eukprot:118750_1